MRTAPAIQVEVTRFGVWRTSVVLLLSLAGGNLVTWVFHLQPEFHERGLLLVVAGSALLALGMAVGTVRSGSFVLTFDGAGWHFTSRASAAGSVPGRLRVALDFGVWLLLRFEPEAAGGGARTVWLPVQRAGLEPRWHALRAAVYSARSASAPSPPPPHPHALTTPNEP